MPGICESLAQLLATVRRPGDFHASGRFETLAPRLEVEGVGQVALPLLAVQAEHRGERLCAIQRVLSTPLQGL